MSKPVTFNRLLLALGLLLASCCPISAQVAGLSAARRILDPQRGLTEAELVARALAASPRLAAQRQQIESARGSVTQARLRANPSLIVGGMKEFNGEDRRFSIGGAMPLELFGRRERRTEVAERSLDASRAAVADFERMLTREVRMRFADALAAARNVEFAEQLLQVNREFLKLMEDRVREGAAAALDADEVRVEVNRIEALFIAFQARAEVDILALKESVGASPDEDLRLRGSLEQPPLVLDPSQLVQLALAHRPDLAERRASEAMALANLRQQESQARPDATFSVSYERPNSGFSQRAFDAAGILRPIRQSFHYAVFGLDFSLPLFNRNQGTIAAAQADISSARSKLSAAELSVRHEVAQNLVRYRAAQQRAAIYRTGVRDLAARNLEVVRQIYAYGRIRLLDLIAEQRRYIDIETGFTDVLFDACATRVALEQALGTRLP